MNNKTFVAMKKILITLIAFIATINVIAQEHLSFKGIPIEGSMPEFCQKLKAKGFTLFNQDGDTSMFTGEFTGRDVLVGVLGAGSGKDVFLVVVLFESNREWNTLATTYSYYKMLYTQKYGVPSFSKENNPSLSDSNISLMTELSQGTVEYETRWTVDGGEIKLSIDKDVEYNKGKVVVVYINSIGLGMYMQDNIDDI